MGESEVLSTLTSACNKQKHWYLQQTSCSLLDKIQPRVVSYEEQVTTVREHLAGLLEKEEDWSKAAQTLAGIDLDSGEHNFQRNAARAMLQLKR